MFHEALDGVDAGGHGDDHGRVLAEPRLRAEVVADAFAAAKVQPGPRHPPRRLLSACCALGSILGVSLGAQSTQAKSSSATRRTGPGLVAAARRRWLHGPAPPAPAPGLFGEPVDAAAPAPAPAEDDDGGLRAHLAALRVSLTGARVLARGPRAAAGAARRRALLLPAQARRSARLAVALRRAPHADPLLRGEDRGRRRRSAQARRAAEAEAAASGAAQARRAASSAAAGGGGGGQRRRRGGGPDGRRLDAFREARSGAAGGLRHRAARGANRGARREAEAVAARGRRARRGAASREARRERRRRRPSRRRAARRSEVRTPSGLQRGAAEQAASGARGAERLGARWAAGGGVAARVGRPRRRSAHAGRALLLLLLLLRLRHPDGGAPRAQRRPTRRWRSWRQLWCFSRGPQRQLAATGGGRRGALGAAEAWPWAHVAQQYRGRVEAATSE